ncbi:12-(S)-hydroxy-5,8,10,14-eicosatetraenoic acid receptor-like [Alosa sapidissima]|uniref:12-(S)-hydroxy-5,8,10,14-eicosatetraenoic acid receptor-like n=1 Tax=Alosa sapidissima TaxID=34773 RepID=UPI001C0A029B|nr:12-(S)-hydroxy-5,8,10,14-eicosatetraenoic acid receptor-like [Alosa sapidissima]
MEVNGTNNGTDHCNTESKLYIFLSVVVSAEFILALPLNLSVLYVFIFKFKFWKNNSLFLFNLVLADLLLLICLPFKVCNFVTGMRKSDDNIICKAMLFMLFLNRGASIAFLTIISVDRYFNVVHSGRKNFLKILKKSPHISILIWLLLLPLTIPTMLETFECCNSFGRAENHTLMTQVADFLRETVFFTQILIPFSVLVFCTVQINNRLRRKTVGDKTKLRRAVFLMASVMLVFTLCFLPLAVSRMILLIVRVREDAVAEKVVVQIYDALMCLSYSDCLLDPLVYCFCCSKFKEVYLSSVLPSRVKRQTHEGERSVSRDLVNSSIPLSSHKSVSEP